MIVIRHSEPTVLDQLPFKSQCRIPRPNQLSFDLYVQISKDEEKPRWEYGGYFLSAEKPETISKLIEKRLAHFD